MFERRLNRTTNTLHDPIKFLRELSSSHATGSEIVMARLVNDKIRIERSWIMWVVMSTCARLMIKSGHLQL